MRASLQTLNILLFWHTLYCKRMCGHMAQVHFLTTGGGCLEGFTQPVQLWQGMPWTMGNCSITYPPLSACRCSPW